MPMPGAVSIRQRQSRERLQCRLRHYMHFLSPAKRSAAVLATSVCELRHGGLRCKLHAGRENRMNACAAGIDGAENILLEVRAGSVTVGRSYSCLPPHREAGARPRSEVRPSSLRAPRFVGCALGPAIVFRRMYACPRCAERAESDKMQRQQPDSSAAAAVHAAAPAASRARRLGAGSFYSHRRCADCRHG